MELSKDVEGGGDDGQGTLLSNGLNVLDIPLITIVPLIMEPIYITNVISEHSVTNTSTLYLHQGTIFAARLQVYVCISVMFC